MVEPQSRCLGYNRSRGVSDADTEWICSRGGGVAAKKRRWEVLDRLARLGQGLSPAQRNDFGWFKETWDSRMLQEYGDSWPEVFMGWMQQLLGENEKGVANAFSLFVHNETRRCFDGVSALRVP